MYHTRVALAFLGTSKDDVPPKKLLKSESHDISYVDSESIDCAKFPCPPFYLTKVAGIADAHNGPDVAIGIKGKHCIYGDANITMIACRYFVTEYGKFGGLSTGI